jgi:hypothetical protein
MSETSSAAQTGTSTLGLGPGAQYITKADPPIAQLVPYITTASSWLINSITSFFRPTLLFWPVPILLYFFAPVIVFFELVVTVFFYGPYKTILYLLDALYPLYVLGGVACITGVVLGFAGRQLCRLLVHLLRIGFEEEDDELRRTKGKGIMKG